MKIKETIKIIDINGKLIKRNYVVASEEDHHFEGFFFYDDFHKYSACISTESPDKITYIANPMQCYEFLDLSATMESTEDSVFKEITANFSHNDFYNESYIVRMSESNSLLL